MANIAQHLYDDKFKPNLFIIKTMLEEGKTTREVCEAIEVSMYEWRACTTNIAEFVELIEELKGKRSMFFTHVLPKYDEIEANILKGWSLNQVSKALKISSNAIVQYSKLYTYFGQFIEKCLEERNSIVAGSLYKRAIGYEYDEKKESIEEGDYLYDNNGEPVYETDKEGNFVIKSGNKIHKRKKGKIKAEKTTKHIAGDVSAQTMWLVNRDSKNWSRKDKEEVLDPVQIAMEIQNSLTLMEKSVPQLPTGSPTDTVMNAISNMKEDDLRALVKKLTNIVEDLS